MLFLDLETAASITTDGGRTSVEEVADEELEEVAVEELEEVSDKELEEVADKKLEEVADEELEEVADEELEEVADEEPEEDVYADSSISEFNSESSCNNFLRFSTATVSVDFLLRIMSFLLSSRAKVRRLTATPFRIIYRWNRSEDAVGSIL